MLFSRRGALTSSSVTSPFVFTTVVPRAALVSNTRQVLCNLIHSWSCSQLRGSIIDSRDRRPLLLIVIVGVPAAMVRAGQGKCVHFVVSGSLDISITGTPIEDAVYD